jgi:hypothetical protein
MLVMQRCKKKKKSCLQSRGGLEGQKWGEGSVCAAPAATSVSFRLAGTLFDVWKEQSRYT